MAPHILVAEDDPLAAMGLEAYLTDHGYRVTTAVDGVAALAAFNTEPADILVTDIRMPRMHGQALIAELRARRPDLPVIVMTGHMTAEMVTVEPCAGRTTIFTKPFRPASLIAAVQDLLRPGGP